MPGSLLLPGDMNVGDLLLLDVDEEGEGSETEGGCKGKGVGSRTQ